VLIEANIPGLVLSAKNIANIKVRVRNNVANGRVVSSFDELSKDFTRSELSSFFQDVMRKIPLDSMINRVVATLELRRVATDAFDYRLLRDVEDSTRLAGALWVTAFCSTMLVEFGQVLFVDMLAGVSTESYKGVMPCGVSGDRTVTPFGYGFGPSETDQYIIFLFLSLLDMVPKWEHVLERAYVDKGVNAKKVEQAIHARYPSLKEKKFRIDYDQTHIAKWDLPNYTGGMSLAEKLTAKNALKSQIFGALTEPQLSSAVASLKHGPLRTYTTFINWFEKEVEPILDR